MQSDLFVKKELKTSPKSHKKTHYNDDWYERLMLINDDSHLKKPMIITTMIGNCTKACKAKILDKNEKFFII